MHYILVYVSHIFCIYVGAYHSATKAKEDYDEADGSSLVLDEVHRLHL